MIVFLAIKFIIVSLKKRWLLDAMSQPAPPVD